MAEARALEALKRQADALDAAGTSLASKQTPLVRRPDSSRPPAVASPTVAGLAKRRAANGRTPRSVGGGREPRASNDDGAARRTVSRDPQLGVKDVTMLMSLSEESVMQVRARVSTLG